MRYHQNKGILWGVKMMNSQDKLKVLETELELCKKKSSSLKRAIWDMLNYANMYVVLLDSEMNIKLINWSLARLLGFKNENEPVGRCWLDFIVDEEKDFLKHIQKCLAKNKEGCEKYRISITNIKTLDNKVIPIKWCNMTVKNSVPMTLSFGIMSEIPMKVTEESIRAFYRDIIEKDKTMIQSLRDLSLVNNS
jgi:PAS domain-containing protein